MRKNKKLLLASVAAMGALALGVGATSTFAWYTATTTAGIADQSAIDRVVAANNPNYQISTGDLPIIVTVTPSTDQSVELGTWLAANPTAAADASNYQKVVNGTYENGFYHAYIDANNVVHYVLHSGTGLSSTLADYVAYTVNIKAAPDYEWIAEGEPTAGQKVVVSGQPTGTYAYWDATNKQTWTNEQIADAIKGQHVNIALANSSSRAMFYGENTSSAVSDVPTQAGAANSATNDVTLSATKSDLQTTGDGTNFYFGVYVEGEHGKANDNNSNPSGNFSVTVTQPD